MKNVLLYKKQMKNQMENPKKCKKSRNVKMNKNPVFMRL